MVGTTGFEPATPASRTLCSTRLSHVPTAENLSKTAAARKRKEQLRASQPWASGGNGQLQAAAGLAMNPRIRRIPRSPKGNSPPLKKGAGGIFRRPNREMVGFMKIGPALPRLESLCYRSEENTVGWKN